MGRWISRDPIEEEGGLNAYAFVDGNPCKGYDFLGLDPIFTDVATKDELWSLWAKNEENRIHKTNPILRFFPGKEDPYAFCPCDDAQIDKGLSVLVANWQRASENIKSFKGINIGQEQKEDSGSCISLNGIDIFSGLGEIPPCWTCYMEHGVRYEQPGEYKWLRGMRDHWWVTCAAYDALGNLKKEISFDYWRSTKDVYPGMSPVINRNRYPLSGNFIHKGEHQGKLFWPKSFEGVKPDSFDPTSLPGRTGGYIPW